MELLKSRGLTVCLFVLCCFGTRLSVATLLFLTLLQHMEAQAGLCEQAGATTEEIQEWEEWAKNPTLWTDWKPPWIPVNQHWYGKKPPDSWVRRFTRPAGTTRILSASERRLQAIGEAVQRERDRVFAEEERRRKAQLEKVSAELNVLLKQGEECLDVIANFSQAAQDGGDELGDEEGQGQEVEAGCPQTSSQGGGGLGKRAGGAENAA